MDTPDLLLHAEGRFEALDGLARVFRDAFPPAQPTAGNTPRSNCEHLIQFWQNFCQT